MLTWVRRTRFGGDSWKASEVPLAEDFEAYEIDILDGEATVRTIAASIPAATYSALDQTADFGAPQPSVRVRIVQLGASYGRGAPRERLI
jgi:hypothetical protein